VVQEWEYTIKRCAEMRLQQEEPLKGAGDEPEVYDNRAFFGWILASVTCSNVLFS
jgi:hypothetical protein